MEWPRGAARSLGDHRAIAARSPYEAEKHIRAHIERTRAFQLRSAGNAGRSIRRAFPGAGRNHPTPEPDPLGLMPIDMAALAEIGWSSLVEAEFDPARPGWDGEADALAALRRLR